MLAGRDAGAPARSLFLIRVAKHVRVVFNIPCLGLNAIALGGQLLGYSHPRAAALFHAYATGIVAAREAVPWLCYTLGATLGKTTRDLPMPDELDTYSYLERNGKFGYVLTEEADALARVLFDGEVLGAGEDGGRGGIVRVPLPSGDGILRRYRRGGFVARLLGDCYFGNRMGREFWVVARLYAAGLPVPAPLGVVWHRCRCCYRGQLLTRAVDGVTLLDFLQRDGAHGDALVACGQAIRAMHEAGVWHADLQVKNILVGAGGVWLIDFDNARDGTPLSTTARARNLLRLRRSLEKHGQSLDNFQTIWEGYGKLGLPRWLSVVYRVRGMVSDALRK